MSFIKMLIGLPLVIIVAIFAFVNNDMATFNLWPFYIEITVSLSVAIIFFIIFGFVLGELFSWLSYAPMRKSLRIQKKQNKKLNKEQQKLVEKVSGLQENIENLKAEEVVEPKAPFKERFKNLFKRSKKE